MTTQAASQAQDQRPGPLHGLRVVELADRSGEWCGRLLADFGADVIKIEPRGGVPERRIGPFYQDVEDPERSLHFWHYNTSKRSVTLDLMKDEGRAILRRMLATADILLETLPPGTLPSMGLGYEDIVKENPGLVYCSLTPFGQTGPWANYRTTDMLHLAAGGQMAACGYDDPAEDPELRPIAAGGNQGYQTGCHFAYMAITAAVFGRKLLGKGQYIDASIHEACALTTEGQMPRWIYHRDGPPMRQTARQASTSPSPPNQLKAADGSYVQLTNAGMQLRRLKAVYEWMDREGKAQDLLDPKYLDPARADELRPHVTSVIAEFIAGLSGDDAMKGGQELSGSPWGMVRAPEDLMKDQHFQERGYWVTVEHPEIGKSFTYTGAPGKYSASPWRIARRAPLIGEDTGEVLSELGISEAEFADLERKGVI